MLRHGIAIGVLQGAIGAVAQAESSKLTLDGAGLIQMNGAHLTASCSATAVWQWLMPSSFDMKLEDTHDNNVTLWTLNVRPTCLYSRMKEPCASTEPGRPPLFFCTFTGELGSSTVGPVVAHARPQQHGTRVVVGCPLPSYAEILSLHPVDSGMYSRQLRLSLSHYAPPTEAESSSIAYEGVAGGDSITLANLAVPPPPAPPTMPLPPIQPPPSAPPACSLALFLKNDDSRADYGASLWTDGSSPAGTFDVGSCEQGISGDVKTQYYYNHPVGRTITIRAYGDGAKLLATAVYPVKAACQERTLHSLVTGGETVFTEAKDVEASSGRIKTQLPWVPGGSGGGSSPDQLGDLFFDFDQYSLVANAGAGWNSANTQTRLTTTMKDAVSANGHWFGGLGGHHYEGGWSAAYESAPSYPYCTPKNMYGRVPGNGDSWSAKGGSNVFEGCGFPSAEGRHHVDFAIFVAG